QDHSVPPRQPTSKTTNQCFFVIKRTTLLFLSIPPYRCLMSHGRRYRMHFLPNELSLNVINVFIVAPFGNRFGVSICVSLVVPFENRFGVSMCVYSCSF
ncbi:hypothetical protein DPEC_G00369570, partial [Dallia pectoralis]